MAHFAKIGLGSIVTQVHVLNNEVLMKDGEENEQQGVEFLQNLHKTTDKFIQTSYNNNFRKNYAWRGYTYDKTRDAFILPKPYPSWGLNEDTCRWEAPIACPSDDPKIIYRWNEELTGWEVIEKK